LALYADPERWPNGFTNPETAMYAFLDKIDRFAEIAGNVFIGIAICLLPCIWLARLFG
jgi:hypothetical protein